MEASAGSVRFWWRFDLVVCGVCGGLIWWCDGLLEAWIGGGRCCWRRDMEV